jgi:hypothetical protein
MSTQAFKLDPSLAGLSPALLKKRYDQLTPEERRALGLTRIATDQEVANAPQPQGQGAPSDFGGPVLPNPNGIKVSSDTDPGGEPTRLPNGVTLQKQNFSGAMPGDVSNPPQAALAGQTAAAQSSPKADTSAWTPVDETAPTQADTSAWTPVDEKKSAAKSEPTFWDDPKTYLENRAKDLQGQAQHQTNLAMGPESEGKPFYERLGHRLLSLAPDTAVVVDKMVAGGMDWKNAIAIAFGFVDPAIPAAYFGAHGAAQLTGVEPGVKAGDTSPENVQNALLAGSAVAGAAGAATAPRAGSTVDLIKAGAEKARNVTPKQAAQAVGATSGAITGHGALSAPGAYYGAKTGGAIAEGILGKERANQPIVPQKPVATPNATPAVEAEPAVAPGEAEEFEGVTSPQTEHAANMEAEATPDETPAATLTKKASPADLEKALNDALGGKPLQKGVSLKNQNQTATAAPAANLPEGFTPVKSSVLRGYKYDPETQQFDSITNDGRHYVHGDVSPEQFKAFEDADSKGKAWPILRGNATPIAKGQMGNPQPIPKAAVTASPEGEVTPLAQKLANLKEIMNASPAKAMATPAPKVNAPAPAATPAATPASADLTSLMQQSLDQAPGKGGVFTSAAPKDLLDRWGVDPDSFTAGREQTRGMSPQESAASIKKLTAAYKKGQTVEPVLETRDANNNIIDVDGRGRAIAAHKAGIDRIPVIVRRMQ